MTPKVSASLETGAVEALLSLIHHSDVQESQRGNGVHIYLHTNSQSPVSRDSGFFRSDSGQQDSDISKQYPDYREGNIYPKDTNISSLQKTDFKRVLTILQDSTDEYNLKNNIKIRNHTNEIDKSKRTSLSMPMLPLTSDT